MENFKLFLIAVLTCGFLSTMIYSFHTYTTDAVYIVEWKLHSIDGIKIENGTQTDFSVKENKKGYWDVFPDRSSLFKGTYKVTVKSNFWGIKQITYSR